MRERHSVDHFLADRDLDAQELLFHYSADGLQPILETGTIKFGTLDGVNDPRESKSWWPRNLLIASGDITEASIAREDEIHNAPDKLLRRGARIACFTGERQPHADADTDGLFHRGWARARMWFQYAANHTGACLVFDRALLAEAVHDARPGGDGDVFSISRVTYVDRALNIPLEGSFSTLDEIEGAIDRLTDDGRAISDLLLTKNTDWQSEDEVRLLLLLAAASAHTHPGPLFLPYAASLRAVVLGEAFEDPGWLDTALATRALDQSDVLRTVWIDGAPRLRPYKETTVRLT